MLSLSGCVHVDNHYDTHTYSHGQTAHHMNFEVDYGELEFDEIFNLKILKFSYTVRNISSEELYFEMTDCYFVDSKLNYREDEKAHADWWTPWLRTKHKIRPGDSLTYTAICSVTKDKAPRMQEYRYTDNQKCINHIKLVD